MISGGTMFLAVSIFKLGTALTLASGIITGVKYFNTYEFKSKKKGGNQDVPGEIDNLREKIRARG